MQNLKIFDFFKEHVLGKGPKIKKRESMVFDYTPPTPPLTLTMIFLLRIFSLNFFVMLLWFTLSKWILSKKNIFKIVTPKYR